jgi:hypothetical protein
MKAIGLSLLACVLVPVLALAQEGKADLNTITSVTVKGGTVEIVGTKKPNFTTFTMTDPPRLVIDISEAVFSGVKEDQTVGNGIISGIRTAIYGSDESAIARVLIGYENEVETDIQATGNALVVSVQGGGGAAVAARPAAPAGTGAAGTAPAGTGTAPAGTGTAGTGTVAAGTGTTPGGTPEQATVAARTDRQAQERAAADATAAAQVDRQAQERAAANATAAAQVDRQAQERAAADAAAAARADAEARKQAEARAAADRKAQEEAARVAAQQAEKERLQQEREAKAASAAAEKQRREEEARAAAEQKKRQQAEAQASTASAAEEKKRQQAEERQRRQEEAQAAAEEKKRQQEETRATAEDRKREQAEERQRQREEAQAAAEERKRQQQESRQTRIAQAETPRAEPRQGDRIATSSGRSTMTLVGFAQESTSSRVFLRTTQPVQFNVTEGDRVVFVVLEDTGIAESNNTRPLDTSFFDTAVKSVDADAGPSRTVRVAIRLKEQVSYQTRQDGNELSIEFQRPARR